MSPPGRAPRVFIALSALVPLLLGGLFVVAALTPYRATLELTPERVAIRHALYGRSWPSGAVEPGSVRAVDFEREPGLAPSWRTNGIGLPGYA